MMANPSLSFCVIVPMYNERANAERCVRVLTETLDELPYRSTLIVVDDGCTDGTSEILKRLQPDCPRLAVVRHERNLGYGCATQTGIMSAKSDDLGYAIFMDSDLTNDPKYIKEFVEKMGEGVDVIKASRYLPGGGMEGVPFQRVAISVIGNRIAGWLMGLPLTDFTNGFRAVRVDLLSRIPYTENGFPIIMEELFHLKRLASTFGEIPNILVSREQDQGASKFLYRPSVFWRYLKYVLKSAARIRPKNQD